LGGDPLSLSARREAGERIGGGEIPSPCQYPESIGGALGKIPSPCLHAGKGENALGGEIPSPCVHPGSIGGDPLSLSARWAHWGGGDSPNAPREGGECIGGGRGKSPFPVGTHRWAECIGGRSPFPVCTQGSIGGDPLSLFARRAHWGQIPSPCLHAGKGEKAFTHDGNIVYKYLGQFLSVFFEHE